LADAATGAIATLFETNTGQGPAAERAWSRNRCSSEEAPILASEPDPAAHGHEGSSRSVPARATVRGRHAPRSRSRPSAKASPRPPSPWRNTAAVVRLLKLAVIAASF